MVSIRTIAVLQSTVEFRPAQHDTVLDTLEFQSVTSSALQSIVQHGCVSPGYVHWTTGRLEFPSAIYLLLRCVLFGIGWFRAPCIFGRHFFGAMLRTVGLCAANWRRVWSSEGRLEIRASNFCIVLSAQVAWREVSCSLVG